ncbi:MAG: pyridoxal-phosphate dependent enzyme [Alphaproteobacteria bacterium]|nr:pyridoxal-phosphate dependent enzyme [Rickettsiales bacterium]
MSSRALDKIEEINHSFSNTPLVTIIVSINGAVKRIYGKYEAVGFTGSGKDRMARFIVGNAYKEGTIKQGDYIVETSSGNAGIALAALGATIGNPVKIFIPDWMSKERYKTLELYGAEVVCVSDAEGGFVGCLEKTQKLGKQNGYFTTNQFGNKLNIDAQFSTTMTEFFKLLEKKEVEPSCFVAGYGTGGIIMAASKMVKRLNINCTVHPLEPDTMPLLSQNRKFKIEGEMHKIEGIVDDFVPDILKIKDLNEPVVINENDVMQIAQKINRYGLSFGISSGANLLGCIAQMVKDNTNTAATVFCDGCNKYYSTDLFNTLSKNKESEMVSKIEVLDIKVSKDT